MNSTGTESIKSFERVYSVLYGAQGEPGSLGTRAFSFLDCPFHASLSLASQYHEGDINGIYLLTQA